MIKIKIIGDSIAAGIGSSGIIDTDSLIFEDGGKNILSKLLLIHGGDYWKIILYKKICPVL